MKKYLFLMMFFPFVAFAIPCGSVKLSMSAGIMGGKGPVYLDCDSTGRITTLSSAISNMGNGNLRNFPIEQFIRRGAQGVATDAVKGPCKSDTIVCFKAMPGFNANAGGRIEVSFPSSRAGVAPIRAQLLRLTNGALALFNLEEQPRMIEEIQLRASLFPTRIDHNPRIRYYR